MYGFNKYRAWLILCPFFTLFSFRLTGQNKRIIDSLEKELSVCIVDTNKAMLLNKLHLEYINGNEKKAMILAKDLLTFSKKINYLKGISIAYSDIAACYKAEENFKEALKYDLLNLEVNEKRGDPLLVAKSYHNIAWTYENMGEHDKALEFAFKKVKIVESVHPPDYKQRLISTYNGIGLSYKGKRQYDSAMKYFQLTELLLKEYPDYDLLSTLWLNKALVFEETDKYSEAINYYNKALVICKEHDLTYKIPAVYQGLCDINHEKGRFDSAIFYANKVYALSISTGLKIYTLYSYESLARAYKRKNDFKNAYAFLEKATDLKDSINSETTKGELSELRIKFETEEKEKEIALLEKNNADIILVSEQRKTGMIFTVSIGIIFLLLILFLFYRNKSKKKQLETEFAKNKIELEQKAFRAQMNPHFIFNSLNSIQRMFIEGKTDQANDVMADFGSLLRRILNNSGKEIISLKEEIDTLKLYLDIEKVRCDECFEYEFSISQNIDLLNIKVPPLVIQPFVENAIWHGVLPKKGKGKIRISISMYNSENELICTVEDNGVGFGEKKILSHESKGIQITEQRLGKKIIIDQPETGGTRIKITIPLNA